MEPKLNEFHAIFEWNMNTQQAEVFKLAMYYEQMYRKICGQNVDGQAIRRNSLPRRGDPRKSAVFRHCWQMKRETRGLIEDHEYKLFILGNLTLLMLQKAYIGPNSICGDKAWIRFKIYKRKYDAKVAELASKTPPPSVNTTSPKVICQIDRTKKFLFERCDGSPTFDKIKTFIESGVFKFWVVSGKVSEYYVILSPFIAKAVDVDSFAEQCPFSAALMRECLTTEINEYFKHEYIHEFVA